MGADPSKLGIDKRGKEYKLMLPALQEFDIKDKHVSAVGIEFFKGSMWDFKNWNKDYKELGSGASCRVLRVTEGGKKKGHAAALKEMKREDEFNPQSFVKEIAILHEIKAHTNVLKFEAGYLDSQFYYIQTGLLQGGELFDRIHSKKRFKEAETAHHIMYILDAIHYCHKQQIVHRDLKPENMVYRVKNGDARTLCIIDFGDAKKVHDEGHYEEFVGTAFYLPPEIVRRRNGAEMKKSDVWSIGVIAYVLLTGRPPFWGNSNKEILKKIIKGKVQFPKSAKLSATAKHFVLNLVQKRIEKRFGALDALSHPFIRKNNNKEELAKVYKRHGIKVKSKK